MNKNNLYRLGAVMYDDDNPSFSRKTTIRKIIESFFILNKNTPVLCCSLPEMIKETFEIELHIKEIHHTIHKNRSFELTNGICIKNHYDECTTKINLNESRYNLITQKEENNSIYKFIDEYYGKIELDITIEHFRELIESFLYTVFIQNMEKSSTIFDVKFNLKNLTDDISLTEENKRIINDFLDYENEEKNRAIFDIGSLALEYVILNGNINLHNNESNILKKILYLDTNIIYRMLGINGEQRKISVRNLISRCIETGQEIRISHESQKEFFDSVGRNLMKVKNFISPIRYTVPIENAIVRNYFDTNSGNMKFYEAKIKAEYETMVKDFGITIDDDDYYSTTKGAERIKIEGYADSIATYKSKWKREIMSDAINVAYIQNLRKGQGHSFREIKEFFLTSDKQLMNWELEKSTTYPVSMYPSNWLSIILKYGSRTSDDYKSFVSFIKNVYRSERRDPEVTLAAMKVIAQKAETVERQKALFDIFVESDYDSALKNNTFEENEIFIEEKVQMYIDERFEVQEKKDEQNRMRIDSLEKIQHDLLKTIEQSREEKSTDRKQLIRAQMEKIKIRRANSYIVNIIIIIISIASLIILWMKISWTNDYKFFITSVVLLPLIFSSGKKIALLIKIPFQSELLNAGINPREIEEVLNH